VTLDPRWSIFGSLFLALLAYFVGVGSLLTDAGWDPITIKHVMAYATIFLGGGNTIVAVLAGIPSKNSTTGFLVSPPAPKP
jgi:hypothetical protein